MRYRSPILPAIAILLASCGGAESRSSEGAAPDYMAVSEQAAAEAPVSPPSVSRQAEGDATGGASAPGAEAAVKSGADTLSGPAATGTVTVPTMLIRTGEARLEVDSLEVGIAQVRALARQLGGYVGNSAMSGGRHQVRSATLELKLPADRFDQALSGLRPLGNLESVNATAQDVGEEFVDLQARRTNSARMEQRLLELLTNRTGKLEDVLMVERELARVREEIERMDGRLRYLRTRAAVSTLTVTLHEPQPLLDSGPGSNPIVRAIRRAWQNFVGFVAGFIALLGILIPLGALLWVAWWGVRRYWPKRTPPAPK